MLVTDHLTHISNVLVIGCGGSGLRSAIEIKKAGLDVCILGKGLELMLIQFWPQEG